MRSGFLLDLREWRDPVQRVSLPGKGTLRTPTRKTVSPKVLDHAWESRQLTPVFPLSRPDQVGYGPMARVADRAVPV